MGWVEKEVTISVDASINENTNNVTYQLWDVDYEIPPEDKVDQVEIFLKERWQRMYFNRVWGKNYDPANEGTWLKQKTAKDFSADTGKHNYLVRYQPKEITEYKTEITHNLFLAPASSENLGISINKPVPEETISEYLPSAQFNKLRTTTGIEGFRLWAMTESNKSVFDQMKVGDEVLLSESGTGKFTHYGQIINKTENRDLGKELWQFTLENPWSLIYFLRNVKRINISKESLVVKFGYEPNFHVPGVIKVSEDRVKEFQSEYGELTDALGISEKTLDLYEDDEEKADEFLDVGKDIPTEATRRKGHQKFAKEVKTNYEWRCAITGITERSFLRASHIIPWAVSFEERLNPSNGLCLSVFFDTAFEKGYISLDDEYHILVNPRVEGNSGIGKLLYPLQGKRITLPQKNPPSRQALDWHRKNVFYPQAG